jgi:hypothetical protein
MRRLAIIALALVASPAVAAPEIHTEDVTSFYQLYASTNGRPTAEQLQKDYLDPGSPGLHRLAEIRSVTGVRIADALNKTPALYADARRCLAALPAAKSRLVRAFDRLRRLYPAAQFPPVTIAVGRGRPVGVSDETGVMIGLEALCAVRYFDADVEDRFVHVITHEYAHTQQALAAPAFYNKTEPTVLERALGEGAADFVAELTSGGEGNPGIWAEVKGHETATETAFLADEDKTDLNDWFDNGDMQKPGDLGYWVGYRIVKAYWLRAPDKRKAMAAILGLTDAHAFLKASGWRPGVKLPERVTLVGYSAAAS